ncbi:MAG TPA: hypothetical protein VFK41_00070 [Nocardioidaceae bacterium]|nr:hypothetical protein [Nocardioidaceae bacterium]
MADAPSKDTGKDERSWLPIALAGGFVAFSVLVAVAANLRDSDSDPADARTVFVVAALAVDAVEDNDAGMYAELRCDDGEDVLTPYVGADPNAKATRTEVAGVRTGSFHLAIEGEQSAEFDVTVERDGDRSCIEDVRLIEATR